MKRPRLPDHRRVERHRRGDGAAPGARARRDAGARRPPRGAPAGARRRARRAARRASPPTSSTPTRPRASRDHVAERHGGGWTCSSTTPAPRGASTFADGGYENVRRTMEINFDAQRAPDRGAAAAAARLGARARSSTSPRPRAAWLAPRTGAYSASKFALAGWSDALRGGGAAQRRARRARAAGLHLDRGLPAVRARRPSRGRAGSSRRPRRRAEAIREAGLGGQPERYVPRPYAIFAAAPRSSRPGSCAASSTAARAGDDDDDGARPRRARPSRSRSTCGRRSAGRRPAPPAACRGRRRAAARRASPARRNPRSTTWSRKPASGA